VVVGVLVPVAWRLGHGVRLPQVGSRRVWGAACWSSRSRKGLKSNH
jgi:hypothetical protein